MEFDDATVLITGGSSGLGAACVRELAALGAGVVIADVRPPNEEDLAKAGDRVLFTATDVTDERQLRSAIETGQQQWGALRGAVLCAGVLHAERVLGREGPASLESFRRHLDVNLSGTFNAARLAAEAMARAEPGAEGQRGVIVLTSSVAAFDGQIGQVAYAAAKGGVAALTLPLARELAQHGIRVVAIAPGVFETPMMQAAPQSVRQSLVAQTPFPRRFGRPQEFAALVRHVFENPMLNGCVLRIDAALRMEPR